MFGLRIIPLSLVFLAALPSIGAKTAPQPPTLEQQMLSHVEKVTVLDTLNVDKFEFFRRYRLNPSAGRILSGDEVASGLRGVKFPDLFEGNPFTGFTNEFNDYLIWSQQDTTGYLRLAESVRLVDGSWSAPEFTPAVLNSGEEEDEDEATVIAANAAFPFMSDDGQTLYYASDNAQSLGGYDIFIATKDPSDGSFLIPGNLGMPFNSPYDDYMMVLDRQSGIGWWASDRNQLEDAITIYLFAISDDRINVDPDDENLMAYATLSGWETLLDDQQQALRRKLLSELPAVKTAAISSQEFSLSMPGGKTYRNFSDFKNGKAASQMHMYLAQKDALDKKKSELGHLREQYVRGDKKLAARIQNLEQQVRTDSDSLRSLLSNVYQLESNP